MQPLGDPLHLAHPSSGITDVAATVARIHVNGIQDGHEVLLAESVDVVTHDEFEASETACNNLVAFMFK